MADKVTKLQSAVASDILQETIMRMFTNSGRQGFDFDQPGRLGQTWYSPSTGKAQRDLYQALGYLKNPVFGDYANLYKRGDISRRIVNAPADATWRLKPNVSEEKAIGDDRSEFEKGWESLIKNLHIYHYLVRIDRLSGIGRYGTLLLGFDDGGELKDPVKKATNLLYLMPYTEVNSPVHKWDDNIKSPRYGLPLSYQLKMTGMTGSNSTGTVDKVVHHSRILHVADGLLENNVYGTPRLEAVLNRLQALELVVGGSGEMFWRGAFPGYNFKLDADADPETQNLDDAKEQIELYVHGLLRYLRLQGVDVQALAPQVADPSKHVDVQLTVISAATGIPKRILTGSERGELASSQDENNWNTRMDERRSDYVEPMILRPFIDQLIEVGVLPSPNTGDYIIKWPSLFTPTEEQQAKTSKTQMEAVKAYIDSGAEMLIPPEIFLKKFLGMTDDEVREALTMLKDLDDELDNDLDEDLDEDLDTEGDLLGNTGPNVGE